MTTFRQRCLRTPADPGEFDRDYALVSSIAALLYTYAWGCWREAPDLVSLFSAIEAGYLSLASISRPALFAALHGERDEWRARQDALTAAFGRLMQSLSSRKADANGVVYTPLAIAEWQVRSTEEALRARGESLSIPGVTVLDPATGTGVYVVAVLHHIDPAALPQKYAEDLWANEVVLLPYCLAQLTIEHAYYQLTGEYAPFKGLCWVDTLTFTENQYDRARLHC